MEIIEIARKTLEGYFRGGNFEPSTEIKEKFKEIKSCFVTLTKEGSLRGCIGSLEARQELWKEVQENVVSAAFADFRFLPLKEKELKDIKIEVSVLSRPQKLVYKDIEELLNKINKEMGIILQKGLHSATFLPQVWEDIEDKIKFLEHLSLKAGLSKEAWKTSEILHYKIKSEKE